MKIIIETKEHNKYCPKCGRLFTKDYNFCPYCEDMDNKLLEVEFK